MSSAGCLCVPKRPCPSGRLGFPSCVAVRNAVIICLHTLLSCCRRSFVIMYKKSELLLVFCPVGWKNGGLHSWAISFPEFRVASHRLGRVQYYSTSGNDKDGLSKSSANDAPSSENILSAAGKATFSPGDKLVIDLSVAHENSFDKIRYELY